MKYDLPAYILASYVPEPVIDYPWDDSNIQYTLDKTYGQQVVELLANISLRSKIALNIAVYEWILARLGPFVDSDVSYKIAEAAWCANINKYYVYYVEFDPYKFLGPIKGPLWRGFSSIISTLYVSDGITDIENIEKYEQYEDIQLYENREIHAEIGLIHNISLALYVLPNSKYFKEWLEKVIIRLTDLYTMPKYDPFANLFGYKSEKDWLGDYVARESLDPSFDYKQEDAIKLLTKYLSNVDYENNPFLVPPEELLGRIEKPYCAIPQL